MEKLKQFFKSKINWSAIILILITLQDHILEMDFTNLGGKEWAAFIIGILIIVFRTYFTALNTVAILLVVSFTLPGCVSMNSAINYARKNGEVQQTTAPNGQTTTLAKVSNFYNPEKVKAKFSKFLVVFDAVIPSMTLTTVTKDTSAPVITPAFKK
jgi:hypothetical protein